MNLRQGRRHFAEIEGVRLHWIEYGQSSAAVPVVMLHGLNDCHLTWERIAPVLAAGRRVFVPDLPGHGYSERPDASYELRWYSRIMAKWLDTVGLKTTDVVGHSFGGGVAQMLLLESRKRIRRLGLVSSGGLGREVAFVLRLASLPVAVEYLGQPFMALGTWLALNALGAFPSEHVSKLCAMNARRGSARAFARTVRDIINLHGQNQAMLQHAHKVGDLPPMAVYWGERDTIIPSAHAKELVNFIEGIQLTIFKGCGHYPHHEQPKSLGQALEKFLDASSPPLPRLINRP